MTAETAFNMKQQKWFEQACAKIDTERMRKLIFELTARHSPTGAEREVCEFLAEHLQTLGIDGRYQPINEQSGNCYGRLRGSGEGPSLMLYAPIDTLLEGTQDDVPWVGPELRRDMVPEAILEDDLVIGLGASNPKCMVAINAEAIACIREAGVELEGDVVIAAAGGGMPWIVPERANAGISNGVAHLLSHGVTADYCIIMKPSDQVYYEHPGMLWSKITTWGSMGYAGVPRGTPGFRSSIVPAARVILELEEWLTAYPERHATALVRPEGWIGAVRSGWPLKPACPSAATEIYVDIRTSPDYSCAQIERELDVLLRDIMNRHPDVQAECETIVSCDAAATDPEHWIVRSATRAWEQVHARKYPGAPAASGQTDAATINRLGIPTVRLGYPWVGEVDMPEEFADGLGGMGVARIGDLIGSVKALIYAVIDSCTRSCEEIEKLK